MSQDNHHFIAEINALTERMAQERDGLGRVISRSNDWMERASIARQCLEAMSMTRNELFGLMNELASPPQLVDYDQIPEPHQEIEQEDYGELPRVMRDAVHRAIANIRRGINEDDRAA